MASSRRHVTVRFETLGHSFAQLPPSWVHKLLDRYPSAHDVVLRLQWAGNSSMYLGWAGGSSKAAASAEIKDSFKARTSSSAEDDNTGEVIEIDAVFAKAQGLRDFQRVEVEFESKGPIAQTANVEPLTPDDWEILVCERDIPRLTCLQEPNAGYVESQLINQVRIVYPNQVVPLWINHQTPVMLRVVDTQPSAAKFAHLALDAEIYVAPKLRRLQQAVDTSAARAVDASSTMPDRVLTLHSRVLPLEWSSPSSTATAWHTVFVPQSWFVHHKLLPSTLAMLSLPKTAAVKSAVTERELLQSPPENSFLANIEPGPDASSIVLSESLRSQIGVEPLALVTVHLLRSASSSSPPLPLIQLDKESHVQSFLATVKTATQACPLVPVNVSQFVPSTLADVGSSNVRLSRVAALPWASSKETTPLRFVIVDGSTDFAKLVSVSAEQMRPSSSTQQQLSLEAQLANGLDFVFGGIDLLIDKCTAHLKTSLSASALWQSFHAKERSHMLLTGGRGSGKTSLSLHLAAKLQRDPDVRVFVIRIAGGELAELRTGALRARLDEMRHSAILNGPTLLLVDDLDKLVPQGSQENKGAQRQSDEKAHLVCGWLEQLKSSQLPTIVLATVSKKEQVHSHLLRQHAFGEVVGIPALGHKERLAVLKLFADSASVDFPQLAMDTEGFSASDLKGLVGRATHAAVYRRISSSATTSSDLLLQSDFEDARCNYTPSSLRGVKLTKSTVSWSDIGGLKETKAVLLETLEWPTRYAPLFAQCPLRLRSGLLLYGPPGCGKTYLASAVARECGLNFVSIKGPELLNKYIGASEQATRDLFERASAAKPCILFFDEFDAIAPRRGHDSTGVTDRVVNQLLTQMDGAEGLQGVYVLAATSRPDLIDPALLRPGRLDKALCCPMPDPADRADILLAQSKHMRLSADVNLAKIGEATEGFSGADLQALLFNASLEAIHDVLDLDVPSSSSSSSGGARAASLAHSVTVYLPAAKERGWKPAPPLTSADASVLHQRIDQMVLSSTSKHEPTSASSLPSSAASSDLRPTITMDHLTHALQTTRPSVSRAEKVKYDQIHRDFTQGRATDKDQETKQPKQRATLA